MMNRISRYYLYQIVGWGLLLIPLWMMGPGGMEKPLLMVVTGFLTSHLLRSIITRFGWLELPLKKVWPRLLAGMILACIVMGFIGRAYSYFFSGQIYSRMSLTFLLAGAIDLVFVIGPWTMLYYFFHYAGRVHRESSRNRKLEMRLKEMEERSRTSGTDMESMMDLLKRIQASIGEDPARCRKEITEFSKLLREGYLKMD